jgi:hypothetical protein
MSFNFARLADVSATGLLEQPVLLLSPADERGRRWLEDARGAPVGFAWQPPLSPWWLRWLFGPTIVHEADEEPVVFQVQRQWTLLPHWHVSDADGEPVGSLGGAWLLDRWDQPVLRCRRASDRSSGSFELPDGQAAADWRRDGDRLRLAFLAPVQEEPFRKMLILASVLRHGS